MCEPHQVGQAWSGREGTKSSAGEQGREEWGSVWRFVLDWCAVGGIEAGGPVGSEAGWSP